MPKDSRIRKIVELSHKFHALIVFKIVTTSPLEFALGRISNDR